MAERSALKPHHSLIHEAHRQIISLHGSQVLTSSNKGMETLLLLQAVVARHNNQQKDESVINCLWDSGPTFSFITLATAKRLVLKGTKIQLTVTKVGGVFEEILSHKYELSLVIQSGSIRSIIVLGLERISTHIQTVKIDVAALFKTPGINDIRRATEGGVDCLLGMDVAGYHPIRVDAIVHLLLLKNEFGLVVGGSHPTIVEKTVKIVHLLLLKNEFGVVVGDSHPTILLTFICL